MPADNRHPIQYEGIQIWKDQLAGLRNLSKNKSEVATYLKFAEVLEHSIRYISFPAFMERIQSLSKDIMECIASHTTVCFLLGEWLEKSNLWVCLLCIGEMRKMGLEEYADNIFCFGSRRIPSIARLKSTRPGPIVLIAFDDMAYSGQQFEDYEVAERFMRCTSPYYLRAYAQIDFYIAVPFVTTVARKKLMSPPSPNGKPVEPPLISGLQAKFFPSTIVLPTFQEQVEEYFKDEPETIDRIRYLCDDTFETRNKNRNTTRKRNKYLNVKRGHNAFGCIFGRGQTAIYFDHKLADYISVMRKLFSSGSYPSNVSYNAVSRAFHYRSTIPSLNSAPFLQGCNQTRREGDCFPAFYKTIPYSYNGKRMNPRQDVIRQMRLIERAPAKL